MVSIFYYTGPYLVPILEKNRSLFGPYRDQIGVGMTLGHTVYPAIKNSILKVNMLICFELQPGQRHYNFQKAVYSFIAVKCHVSKLQQYILNNFN